jgi:hypothetical protein
MEFEAFRDKHVGEDIYILASGPSFDHIDPVFLKGKITIGINEMYKFAPCTYLVRKDPALLKQSLAENPSTVHFITKYQYGGSKTLNSDLCKDLSVTAPIVFFSHNANVHKLPEKLPENGLVTSYSTITTAIHLAAHLGAKTILLIGHDCGTLDGKVNCSGYYTDQKYKICWPGGEAEYRKWVPTIEADTIRLKGLIKERYGCAVHSINPFVNFGLEGHIYAKTG